MMTYLRMNCLLRNLSLISTPIGHADHQCQIIMDRSVGTSVHTLLTGFSSDLVGYSCRTPEVDTQRMLGRPNPEDI